MRLRVIWIVAPPPTVSGPASVHTPSAHTVKEEVVISDEEEEQPPLLAQALRTDEEYAQ